MAIPKDYSILRSKGIIKNPLQVVKSRRKRIGLEGRRIFAFPLPPVLRNGKRAKKSRARSPLTGAKKQTPQNNILMDIALEALMPLVKEWREIFCQKQVIGEMKINGRDWEAIKSVNGIQAQAK